MSKLVQFRHVGNVDDFVGRRWCCSSARSVWRPYNLLQEYSSTSISRYSDEEHGRFDCGSDCGAGGLPIVLLLEEDSRWKWAIHLFLKVLLQLIST